MQDGFPHCTGAGRTGPCGCVAGAGGALPVEGAVVVGGVFTPAPGVLKFTRGAFSAPAAAWKKGYSVKPDMFAIALAGNERTLALYACTRSL